MSGHQRIATPSSGRRPDRRPVGRDEEQRGAARRIFVLGRDFGRCRAASPSIIARRIRTTRSRHDRAFRTGPLGAELYAPPLRRPESGRVRPSEWPAMTAVPPAKPGTHTKGPAAARGQTDRRHNGSGSSEGAEAGVATVEAEHPEGPADARRAASATSSSPRTASPSSAAARGSTSRSRTGARTARASRQSLVHLWAPLGREVTPTPEFFRWAATEGQDYRVRVDDRRTRTTTDDELLRRCSTTRCWATTWTRTSS